MQAEISGASSVTQWAVQPATFIMIIDSTFFIPKVLFNVNNQAHTVARVKCYPSVSEIRTLYYEYVCSEFLFDSSCQYIVKQAMLICILCDFKQ